MKDSLSFWCFVFLLHCLIYKVQTALVSGALSYHTRWRLSSTFFSRFATRFTPQSGSRSLFPASVSALIQAALASANFVILPRRFRFVKNFFRLNQRFFIAGRLALAAPSGAQLIYQNHARLSTESSHFFRGFSLFLRSKTCLFQFLNIMFGTPCCRRGGKLTAPLARPTLGVKKCPGGHRGMV
jgi:hypothetical protein